MIEKLTIQLLYFPGCPNLVATRKALAHALENFSLSSAMIEDINVLDAQTPETLKKYPSPTILINGKDIEGLSPGDAAACRIYPGGRAPRLEIIETALKANMR